MGLTIGVDVGGTKIAAGVVDDTGAVLTTDKVGTPAADPTAVQQAIAALITTLAAQHPVEAVGIGAAGFVDAARDTVLFAPNLAWRNVALRAAVADACGLPVVVENDANAAAWGEYRFGAGAGVDDLLCVTVGTGIGGGIVTGGRLYRGTFGVAAEVGHMRVIPDGRRCVCGNRGCWEQYASGRALVAEAQEVLRSGSLRAARLAELAGGDPVALTGPMVTAAAMEGDELSLDLLEELGSWLGQGVASLVAVLDPGLVVVGGGVSEAGDLLAEPARQALLRHLTARRHRPVVELRLAALGNTAGLIGAADLARQR
jgi:glucokinase